MHEWMKMNAHEWKLDWFGSVEAIHWISVAVCAYMLVCSSFICLPTIRDKCAICVQNTMDFRF